MPTIAVTTPPGLPLGLGHLCVPRSTHFPSPVCFRSSVVLWHGVSWAGAVTHLGLGCAARQSWETLQLLDHTCLRLALGASQCVCVRVCVCVCTSHEQSSVFFSLFICSRAPPTSQGCFSPPLGPQDCDAQSMA